ncbi:hypothetical protein NDU88_001707 [Pleurodeles waltl]|uniref:Uncharacterized protein n=1 Tax=Pleurodeles waltl TaxID=8319 RepID=A0AAV7SAM0_PLEWA|nr:hypothetical protein NDU88_001707 [Pleurodeles waltl]
MGRNHMPLRREARGLPFRPRGGVEHQRSPARLPRPLTSGRQPPQGARGLRNPPMQPPRCASSTDPTALPRSRGVDHRQRKAGRGQPYHPSSRGSAFTPGCSHAKSVGRRQAHHSSRGSCRPRGPPCLRPPPQAAAPQSQGAADFDPGRRSWQEKCQRIAPAQRSITKWQPFAGRPSHAPPFIGPH